MADQPLLSDLCRICNDATPKYCCPRCSTRTCSLQCYKRHQVWSQCSGKRDPGAFVRRSQLATPAGIDRDYNFLSGIERAFDAADRDAEGRGISVSGGSRKGHGLAQGSNLQQRLEASGAVIRRAPVGMSRQKSNRTQWHSKSKCLNWTVEWIHPDGTKELAQCRESMPLSEAYQNLSVNVQLNKKRKVGTESIEQNAKQIKTEEGKTSSSAHEQAVSGQAEESVKDDPAQHHRATEVHCESFNKDGAADLVPPRDASAIGKAATEVSNSMSPAQPQSVPPTANQGNTSNTTTPDFYFYLLNPNATATSSVLIPLLATSTLSTCLKNRVILEYPTIQVLWQASSDLPEGFLLDLDYHKQEKKMIEELEAEEKRLGVTTENGQARTGKVMDEGELEDSRIFDSLRKDLANVKEMAGG